MSEITIKYQIEDKQLWSSVFGATDFPESWYQGLKWIEGDWETPGKVLFKMDDPNEENGFVQKEVDMAVLLKAFEEVMNKEGGYWHCNMRVDTDFDNYDSCVADIIIQQAVYGDYVYG